ncbi:MAG TPA: hypothetical protein DIT89_11470, partial [Planctomycetaceae bacterium]|nr:hypothetical protein [Planctomycetaceae bacterium]
GHVLDCQSEGRTFRDELAGGERWRTAIGNPAEDELVVSGSRVLTAGNCLVAPWSERLRYGMRKNGYHGGVTPQEMVIPIAVLSSTESFPVGWSEQPVDIPIWWDDTGGAGIHDEPAAPIPVLKPVPVKSERTLFDEEDRSASGVAPPRPATTPTTTTASGEVDDTECTLQHPLPVSESSTVPRAILPCTSHRPAARDNHDLGAKTCQMCRQRNPQKATAPGNDNSSTTNGGNSRHFIQLSGQRHQCSPAKNLQN